MKTATVALNGMEMFYEADGSGEPLLLLHGGGGCHEDWIYAGREEFVRHFALIAPDARGRGRSTNPARIITPRQCASDALALLDHLRIERCKAIGLSMGGNILLHMATMQPDRIEAMVVVSATTHFPEQARAIMRQVPVENHPPQRVGHDAQASQIRGRSNQSPMGVAAWNERQLRRYESHPGNVCTQSKPQR